MSFSLDDLKAKLKRIRRGIIESTSAAASGHPTSSLSAAEIATTIFFGGFLKQDVKNPHWSERDRFILSKGHAAPLLYALMAEAGHFPASELITLRKLGSPLEGHPNYRKMPAVEASTGSLGQGLSIGVGHALAGKLDKLNFKVFVIMGDGEIGEGQVWEAAMSASKFKLDNLVAIVDQNGYQQTGATKEVLDLTPIAHRWEAFGWSAQTINGNDLTECHAALTKATQNTGKPNVIISQTKKGFPIMEILAGDPNHHGKPLTKDETEKALAYIESL